jgi:serine/threonine-protein kinase
MAEAGPGFDPLGEHHTVRLGDEPPTSPPLAATPTPAPGVDTAAPRDQQRALEHEEHVNDVRRMRSLSKGAALMWASFGLLDWIVVTYIHPGSLWFYWGLRVAGAVPILGSMLVIWRDPIPSRRAFLILDLVMFTSASALISAMCLEYGGLTSPYVSGVVFTLLARGAVLAAPWRRALLIAGVPALAFPAVLLAAGLWSDEIAAQLADPTALAGFAQSLSFVGATVLMLVWGSHAMFGMRRQAFAERSIGKYELKRRVGRGGMGEVWAAYHRQLKRDVAL